MGWVGWSLTYSWGLPGLLRVVLEWDGAIPHFQMLPELAWVLGKWVLITPCNQDVLGALPVTNDLACSTDRNNLLWVQASGRARKR